MALRRVLLKNLNPFMLRVLYKQLFDDLDEIILNGEMELVLIFFTRLGSAILSPAMQLYQNK